MKKILITVKDKKKCNIVHDGEVVIPAGTTFEFVEVKDDHVVVSTR